MANRKDEMRTWLSAATCGIRFGPDRKAVEAELREHMEDKQLDLQRIFPDMSEDEAVGRVLDSMGDPEEIGRELARIHKPWLGYLWKFSQVTLVILVLVVWGYGVVFNDYYASRGGSNLFGYVGGVDYVELVGLVPEQAELGGYTFRIIEAVYRDWPEEQRSRRDQIEVRLRVSSPRFWERVAPDVLNDLTVVTQDGSRWLMDRAVVGRIEETGEQYLLLGASQSSWSLFYREFTVYVDAPWEEGDRIGLEFDFEQGSFGLSAQVIRRVME